MSPTVPGRLVLVVTSPRTPPGLLSWPAWEALRAAPVRTADAEHPQLPYLRDAGVDVEVTAADAADLHARAVGGEHVVWLASQGEEELARRLGMLAVRSRLTLEVVYGSYDPPGARLLDVVQVMDRLRSPGGCPWDARQTHESLKPYLLEEAYEAYEAIEDGSRADLREELGDVLLQIAFHARLAQEHEHDPFSIDDVAGDLVDKLVRRHPHVFAGTSADDVEATWEQLKAAEKGRTSVTDGVPLGQPALSLAAKLQKRASRIGAPVPAYDGLGGELWALVQRCREAGLDPEVGLRAVARAYRDRLAELERANPDGLTPEEWGGPVELIGTVVRLQVQRSRLKPGPAGARVYDPSPLLEVSALEVGPRGVTGDGLLDVHHADHQDSRNVKLRNGLSVMTRPRYEALRARFGAHLLDGIAGESLLLDDGTDVLGQVRLETDDGLLALTAEPAPPCVEFARFCLRAHGTGADVLAAVDALQDGARGFYLQTEGTGRVTAGCRLFRA